MTRAPHFLHGWFPITPELTKLYTAQNITECRLIVAYHVSF